jgi:hypothetical protein
MKNESIHKFLSPIGYIWAAIGAIVIVAMFFNMWKLSHAAAGLPFVKVHPRYSGGEVVEAVDEAGAKWTIHRAVFDGLIAERSEGFVQIDVEAAGKGASLERAIDWNRDGKPDFTLQIPTDPNAAPTVSEAAPEIAGVGQWARTKTGWIVRVAVVRKGCNSKRCQ